MNLNGTHVHGLSRRSRPWVPSYLLWRFLYSIRSWSLIRWEPRNKRCHILAKQSPFYFQLHQLNHVAWMDWWFDDAHFKYLPNLYCVVTQRRPITTTQSESCLCQLEYRYLANFTKHNSLLIRNRLFFSWISRLAYCPQSSRRLKYNADQGSSSCRYPIRESRQLYFWRLTFLTSPSVFRSVIYAIR